ncbi:MAG: hypothetical protein JXR97_08315 [Planctomycetes bacterium]|nr:hypothetical protein [Planctomycetota bacterium]
MQESGREVSRGRIRHTLPEPEPRRLYWQRLFRPDVPDELQDQEERPHPDPARSG